ncbi:starch synthase 3 [Perilla frutescens var. hirtella]|uniref:starch synthase n=1 Tax=Perilla frutescens var. hirtella TaxID=608512 RepID=A0AAD4JD65_PERFH|nr:starch synthase 3 [Perilla frutescens var. hirtella]
MPIMKPLMENNGSDKGKKPLLEDDSPTQRRQSATESDPFTHLSDQTSICPQHTGSKSKKPPQSSRPLIYIGSFVFSEREDGGIFDNKNGMDYHIPVLGGVVKEPPIHIVHIAVEMAPIAKVGGLGDVVTSLSRAVQDMNHNVEIILPK